MPWIKDVEFIAADIHAADVDVVALTEGVDVLAHLAWPGLPNYRGLFHFEHNLMADYRFIKSVVEAGVKHVLVTGTCFEYGLQSGPLSERSSRNHPIRMGWPSTHCACFAEPCAGTSVHFAVGAVVLSAWRRAEPQQPAGGAGPGDRCRRCAVQHVWR
jgi:nucleoside-diphosphate-sugar epimerase